MAVTVLSPGALPPAEPAPAAAPAAGAAPAMPAMPAMPAVPAVPAVPAEGAVPSAPTMPVLTEAAYRDWLLPGVEDLFRNVYTRACPAPHDTIAICSALSGEGRTTVSLGLAVTIASDHIERSVVLVEADVLNPALATDFELPPQPGFAECVTGESPLVAACRPTFLENLFILPAGGPVRSPGRLLHSHGVVALMRELRETFDVVIVDVPAVLTTSAATGLANQADGVLLVVRAGVTPAHLVSQALSHFGQQMVRGVVLNATHSRIPRWLRAILGL
jgi:Mrp family chromosome partitioning ATPase